MKLGVKNLGFEHGTVTLSLLKDHKYKFDIFIKFSPANL